MSDAQITPLNSNGERPYPSPAIYEGNGVSPIDVPAFSSKWTSTAQVYQITESTGFMTGQFTSTADTNTDALGVVPAGFLFTGVRIVASYDGSTHSADALVIDSDGNLTISGGSFSTGDIVHTEFAFNIVG